MTRRQTLVLGSAVAWTLFLWATRVRNALGDESLEGAALGGVLLLSASFLVGASAVAALAWRSALAASRSQVWPTRALVVAAVSMAAWNAVVWAARITDIVMDPGHDLAFVVVHCALGLISMVLWLITVFVLLERGSEEIASIG